MQASQESSFLVSPGLARALSCGVLMLGLAFAVPAAYAAGGGSRNGERQAEHEHAA